MHGSQKEAAVWHLTCSLWYRLCLQDLSTLLEKAELLVPGVPVPCIIHTHRQEEDGQRS